MLAVRLVKTSMVASIALFALLVAFDNVVDYDSNYEFVRHTLSMDTTFPGNALRGRAITSPVVWGIVYWVIILVEAATGIVLALARSASRSTSGQARPASMGPRRWSSIGVGLGFLLWFTGFMVVGGEWFAMWQSKAWNGQQATFWFYMTLLAVRIFVNQRDGELSR